MGQVTYLPSQGEERGQVSYLPMNIITDTSENITIPCTTYVVGKNVFFALLDIFLNRYWYSIDQSLSQMQFETSYQSRIVLRARDSKTNEEYHALCPIQFTCLALSVIN